MVRTVNIRDLKKISADLSATKVCELLAKNGSLNIKINKIVLPVKIEKKRLGNKTSVYVMYYDKTLTENLYPFYIQFKKIMSEDVNSAYIANIHNTYNLSGSVIVESVIKILQAMNIKRVYLGDGAEVDCKGAEVDLSMYKVIEKGRTYYMKFGFKLYNNVSSPDIHDFKDENVMMQQFDQYLSTIRKIRVSEVLNKYRALLQMLNKVILDQKYANFTIMAIHDINSKPYNYREIPNPQSKILNLIELCTAMIDILNKSKNVYLYKYLIKLIESGECIDYQYVINRFTNGPHYIMKYNEKTINMEYTAIFEKLDQFIHWRWYYLDL